MRCPGSNPFATRYTRPGRIESLDSSGRPIDVDGLVGRLHELGGMAAIVGPHGSGKSTLLAHLAAAIRQRGDAAAAVIRSWRDVPAVLAAIRAAGRGGVVCADSWECLGVAAGTLVRVVARLSRRRLVVTSHHPAGLPVLARNVTSGPLLHAIVAQLPDSERWMGSAVAADDVDRSFRSSGGNIREALWSLYDLFEARNRPSGSPPRADDGRTRTPAESDPG